MNNIVSCLLFRGVQSCSTRLVFNGVHDPSVFSLQLDTSRPITFDENTSLVFASRATRVAAVINAVRGPVWMIAIDPVHVVPEIVIAIVNLGARCETKFILELGSWPRIHASYDISSDADPFALYEQLLEMAGSSA